MRVYFFKNAKNKNNPIQPLLEIRLWVRIFHSFEFLD